MLRSFCCALLASTLLLSGARADNALLDSGMWMRSPDGDIVPDFTAAGIHGGIPDIQEPVFDVTQYGADGSDDEPDGKAIQAAVAVAVARGGGVVYLPNGTYQLDECIEINHGNIVVRGESRDGTVLVLNNATTGGGFYDARATIHFKGPMKIDFTDRFLAQPAEAGATTLHIAEHSYQPGQFIIWEGRPTATWLRVEAVNGDAVTIHAPLRFSLAPGEGKFRGYGLIQRVGVESLTIRTPRELNTNGVNFYGVWEGWMRDVAVLKPGRFPVGFNNARYIEIRDSLFDDAWKKGSGGVGYGGFWSVNDGLMDNVTMRNLRHAPNLQDGATGCVIRNSTFENSDMQWHTSRPSANLVENCTIKLDSSARPSHTLRSSRPGIDTIHSPAGAGNVVWHCDFQAESNTAGADFGHEMHNWLFAYNRIVIAGGGDPALRIWYDAADNFVLRSNVIATRDQRGSGGVRFVLKDQDGPTSGQSVKFIDNTFHGWTAVDGKWWHGAAAPDVDENNTLHEQFATPDRPAPPKDASGQSIVSLYEWQLQQKQQQQAVKR